MLKQLPRELFEVVIDQAAFFESMPAYPAHLDCLTLCACSLVCRDWVPRTRHHMFGRCTLIAGLIRRFIELLRSHLCTFAIHIHYIKAVRIFGNPEDKYFDEDCSAFQALTRVKTVDLILNGTVENREAFFNGFISNFVHAIELHLGGYFSGTALMVDTICRFSSIEKILVDPICKPVDDSLCPPCVLPKNLSHIMLSNYGTLILPSLCNPDRSSNIHSLVLHFFHTADPFLSSSLKVLGGSLRELELNFWGELPVEMDLINLDLSSLINLRTLRLNLPPSMPYDRFVTCILTLSSGSLERLSCRLHEESVSIMNWAALDSFLSSPHFPCLDTISFDIYPGNDREADVARIRENLPLLLGPCTRVEYQ
ncbi:hypothetical protein C8J57DRAFT_1327699 [Mycena rebaudengoi]|nr:hypothetical protein C8J57DRAFT_1327699 [Mycena rebaudengoi]